MDCYRCHALDRAVRLNRYKALILRNRLNEQG